MKRDRIFATAVVVGFFIGLVMLAFFIGGRQLPANIPAYAVAWWLAQMWLDVGLPRGPAEGFGAAILLTCVLIVIQWILIGAAAGFMWKTLAGQKPSLHQRIR